MNRRILVVEPDLTVRRMTERALSAGCFAPMSVPTMEASRAVLDAVPIEAAVVELRATHGEGTCGIRDLRADYPELPIVVTGTLLTPRIMQELMRFRVDDVITKPFTPRTLIEAVERMLRDVGTRGAGGMEYAAAMVAARRAIVEGRLGEGHAPLERAHAVAPLDAEAMALLALSRELEGRDEDAVRGYRAALALAEERVSDDALPAEGLARLHAYGGARPIASLQSRPRPTVWFVGNTTVELSLGPPRVPWHEGTATSPWPDVTVFALGLVPGEGGATYARIHPDGFGFMVATGALTDRMAGRILRTFDEPSVLAYPSTLSLLRWEASDLRRPSGGTSDKKSSP